MKHLFYVPALAFSLVSVHVNAQVDSSYRTTYYLQKVSQYEIFIPSGKKVVMFIGDSITDIAEWNELLHTTNVLNRGISADNTFGVLHRLKDVARRRPRKVFLMIGINDISHNIPDDIILKNYRQIIRYILSVSPETRIFVQSILPTNSNFTEFARHQNKDGHIRNINRRLQEEAANGHYVYIDLYPLFLDKEGKMDEKYTNDGLHLKAAGYKLWCDYLKSKKYL